MKGKVAVTLDGVLLKRLDRMAARLETSRSALLERFLADGLDDQEPVVEYLVSPAGRAGWCKLMPVPNAEALLLPSIGPRISGQERRNMMAVVKSAAAGKAGMRHDGR